MVGFVESIPTFGGTAISRFLPLCVDLADAYKLDNACLWYHSIDMECLLFHIDFECELSISDLRKTAISFQKGEMETCKFLKPHKISNSDIGGQHTKFKSNVEPTFCFFFLFRFPFYRIALYISCQVRPSQQQSDVQRQLLEPTRYQHRQNARMLKIHRSKMNTLEASLTTHLFSF